MTRVILAVILASFAWGQSFEVASIRLHKTPVQGIGVTLSGPRFTAAAMSLDNLIVNAYSLQSYQVSGVPAWGSSNHSDCDRYDINAKAEGDGTLLRDKSKKMLQALLGERFHLQFHYETKNLPVYNLVIAKGGHKLKVSPPDAESTLMTGGVGVGIEMTVTKGSMMQLVTQFSNSNGVNRPVLDKTLLAGNYDYALTWTLDAEARGTDPEAVSIALEKQLGLKLESSKAPIQVLVIDHVEKPSEN